MRKEPHATLTGPPAPNAVTPASLTLTQASEKETIKAIQEPKAIEEERGGGGLFNFAKEGKNTLSRDIQVGETMMGASFS